MIRIPVPSHPGVPAQSMDPPNEERLPLCGGRDRRWVWDEIQAQGEEDMTVREKLERYLNDNGLSPTIAIAVFDLMLERHGEEDGFKGIHWNDPAHGYPDSVYDTLLRTLRPTAVAWIDEQEAERRAE